MSEEQPRPESSSHTRHLSGKSLPGDATYDVTAEAQEALRRYNLAHPQDARAPGSAVFDDGMVLRIEIVGSDTPLLVTPKVENVIGRRDPLASSQPDLDLTPYAGYQMGISRIHAVIRWEEQQLAVYDLESRNGTFVNGKKLSPNQPHPLHHGDELRLGKMVLRLYFEKG